VTLTASGLVGVSVATGKKLWGIACAAGSTTPVLHKDLLIFAAGDKERLRAIRLEKAGKGVTAKEIWEAKGHPLYYSSPVLAGDLLFGMSVGNSGHFFCLDANTGQTLWEGPARLGLTERREGNASIVKAGNVLLFLTDRGRLLVVKPTATAFEPITEYRVSDTPTWAHPVFLGDRILIRDRTTLRCFRIAQDDGNVVEIKTITEGDLKVVIRDNAQSPQVLSGLASLLHQTDAPDFDAFDPDDKRYSAGLNFEHIISGHKNPNNKLTPRRGPYRLLSLPEGNSAQLVRETTDDPWAMSSTLKYSVVAPHYIDVDFRCTPHDKALFGKRGYAVLFSPTT